MKNILKLALILFVITTVVAAALAGVNSLTADKIAASEAEKMAAAVEAVLPGQSIVESRTVNEGIVKTVYLGETGYACQVTPNGFGGTITMMVGVSADGTVLGVQIVSHSETPGLGAKAQSDEDFLNSFLGLTGAIEVSKDGGEADTLTSATITSRAVAEGVSAAVEYVTRSVAQNDRGEAGT